MTSDERRMAVKDEQESFGSREEVIIVAVTFFFVSSTLALTARTFCSHFAYWVRPALQRNILRIICVAPVFSVGLWMSVVLPQWRLFFDVFMGFYEGYVIYCFFAVMVLTGGGDAAAIMTFINQGSPFSYYCCGLRLFTFDDAPALYRFMRLSVLQYVFLKPALLLVVAVLDMTGRNGMYIQFVVLCSTMWAFASLIQTSYRLRSTLAAHTTNKKMAVIKVLIVVVALQQLAMNLLFGYDVIHGGDDKKFSAQERADRIYAFVCIVEAFVYSIMLQRTFTHREFRNLSVGDDNGVGRGRCSSMCLDVLELWHVFSGLEELERPIMKDLDVLDEL